MSKNKLLRVTQLNSVYLDKEIYKLFLQVLNDTSKFLPPGFVVPFEPELNLIIKLSILYNSIYKNGSTFGQQLLSIKYDKISQFKRILYIFGNCLDYLQNRFEMYAPSHQISKSIYKIQAFLVLFDFINICIFLRKGTKPILIERLLGLNQVFSTENAQRQFESKYMARELLWNGFIDILLYVLPLINYHKIKRTIRNCNPFRKKTIYRVIDSRTITMHSKCAHCGLNPILPHHMGCTHVFCYVCLKGNQTADSKYECPICEHSNPNILCDKVSVMV